MNAIKSFASAVALSSFAATAFAFPVDLDSVSGKWQNASGGQYVNGEGTNQIRWGKGLRENYYKQSGYGFEANNNLPVQINDSSPFVLGTFTHYNYEIQSGTAINSVDLAVYAGFSSAGGNELTGPFTYNFGHNETPNNAPVEHCDFWCQFAAKWFGIDKSYTTFDGPVNDIVTVTFENSLNSEFTLDSKVYSLNLIGFEGNASELSTPEHKKTSVNLLASLTVREVPEPGTLALLSLGLIGLTTLRRRS